MSKHHEFVVDEQTGHCFQVIPEHWYDIMAAWISAAYSLAAIAYLGWVLLDTWTGQFSTWFLQPVKGVLGQQVDANVFRLVVYTAIGGGMGAAINNIRGFLQWHAERRGFGWRFVWKYIALPPLGAALAVLVYGILQSGIAVFNGGTVNVSSITSFSAWAIGTLAGYGSHQVFIWLDDKVSSLFKVERKKVTVPDLAGKNEKEAAETLGEAKLTVGEISHTPIEKEKIGKVIAQDPAAGAQIACESKVALTIGIEPAVKDAGQLSAANVLSRSQDQKKQTLPNGKLTAATGKQQTKALQTAMTETTVTGTAVVDSPKESDHSAEKTLPPTNKAKENVE